VPQSGKWRRLNNPDITSGVWPDDDHALDIEAFAMACGMRVGSVRLICCG
jgi:hypothetical protein